MKRNITIALALTLLVATNAFGHGKKTESEALMVGMETEASKVVLSFHKALDTGDKELARQLLADDVQIYEGGRVERSADEYAHHHMLADMKYSKAMTTKTIEHQVRVMGSTAVSMSRSQTKGTYKGKDRDYEGMETMVLEKQGGDWKIVHIHWSH